VAALAVLGLAACASVPTSGPIEQGPVVDAGESTQFIRVIAAPPSPGAEPAEIVRGFLEANASLEQDHAIARRYLTQSAAASWDPSVSTTVYDQASLQVAPRKDRVRVDVQVTGFLRDDGTLDHVVPAVAEDLSFSLEQVPTGPGAEPQWRISDPPPGILLSAADLRRAYRLYETYFMAARSAMLVPDGRLLPVVGASLPTTLAERVLAGPSEWLAPGVQPGPPPGTGLALGAVPVSNGVAEVDLTEEARAATGEQRRDLAAQLTWTLTQLPDVTAVRLRVGGEPFDVPGAPDLMDRQTWRGASPDAASLGPTGDQTPPSYTLEEGTLVRTAGSGTTAIEVPVEGAGSLIGLAVSLDQRRAAAVEPDRETLWLLPLDRSTTPLRVAGERVGSISFDVDGQAWYVDAGRIMRIGTDRPPREVPLRAPGLAPITALQLARDGTRVALLAGGLVHLGVLEAHGDGVAVGSVRPLGAAVAEARDLAWRDAGTLDVLGVPTGSARQVARLTVGNGQVLPLGAPARPVDVAAAPTVLTLAATRDAQVFGNVGLQWREQGPGRAVAYPG
jgi:hypothetical protein